MKNKILLTLSSVFVLACASEWAGEASVQDRIARAHNIASLTLLFTELETSWPTNASEYFQDQNQLNAALQSFFMTNATAKTLFEKQTEQTLAKPCPKDISYFGACFSAKKAIMERISKAQVAPRLEIVREMAKSLGETRNAIIINYQFVPVSANITPPIIPTNPPPSNGIRLMFSGMSVDAIDDPVARDAYKKALETNRLNNTQNTLQGGVLSTINRAMTTTFLNYTEKLLASEPKTKSQIDDLAKTARLTAEERKQLE